MAENVQVAAAKSEVAQTLPPAVAMLTVPNPLPSPLPTPPPIDASLMGALSKLTMQKTASLKNSDRLKIIQGDSTSHLSSMKEFKDMGLPEHLLKGVYGMGFTKPSAIQEQALPRVLHDPPLNLIAQAQSGSGKTAAFVLGMLYR